MSDNEVFRCPLCQGDGELRGTELIECLTDEDLKAAIERYVAKVRKLVENQKELAPASGNGNGASSFEKKEHDWNPHLPIWRRSPKE